MRSVGTNAFLNVIRTILALFVPLITYPYVSRIIGVENLGKVNYVQSIVSYFVLLSGLGISTYGIREGAKIRNNSERVSKFISECFTIAFYMCIISTIALLLVISIFPSLKQYKTLFLIEVFLILFDTIGIEWVNTVFEDYLYITIRTILIQLVSIFAVFTIIHNTDDYYLYAAITVGTTGLVSILNWFHCKKRVAIRLTSKHGLTPHFKPILVFFANKLAVSLYVNSDITMLGYIVGDYSVGLYSTSVKIYTIIKNMMASIYTVTIPRLASLQGAGKNKEYKKLLSQICCFVTLAIFPATAGLFFLSHEIILLLFREQYTLAYTSLRILSIGIIFAIYGGIVTTVYNVTQNNEKYSLRGTILAAFINIALNIVLIPALHEVGAAITTVIAEMVTLLYCFFHAKGIIGMIDWKMMTRSVFHALIGCMEIFVIIQAVKTYASQLWIIVTISILFSLVVYAVTLFLFKDTYLLALFKSEKSNSEKENEK